MGRASIICPIVSCTKSKGPKAACVVKIAANTGKAMRLPPMVAAVVGSSPMLNLVAVCSPTTIASSTIMPSIISKAKSEIILMVWPIIHMMPSVANKAIGMPAATQNAILKFKNANKIIKTRTRPLTPFFTKSIMRSRTRSDRRS